MKAVSVERFTALPRVRPGSRRFPNATGALVPAALVAPLTAPKEKWDVKPEARGDLELNIREPGPWRNGCRQEPSSSPSSAARTDASPVLRLDRRQKALPGSVCPPAAEEPLALLEGRRSVLSMPWS